MTARTMWDDERPIRDTEDQYDVEVPRWIDGGITWQDVAAIRQGGCASGAYMPAVTYHEALATMAEFGDEVLSYLDINEVGDLPEPDEPLSWVGLACRILSAAVEQWAFMAEDEWTPEEEETDA